MRAFRQILLIAVMVCSTDRRTAWAQPALDGLWKPVPSADIAAMRARPLDSPTSWNRSAPVRYFKLDRTVLRDAIDRAPSERAALPVGGARPGPTADFLLPFPDGKLIRFHIEETRLLHPKLAAKYRDIRTFRGRGADDPSLNLRLEVTAAGVSAQVLSPHGTVLIDPTGDQDIHAVARKGDLRRQQPFRCLVEAPAVAAARPAAEARATRSGDASRTYRLAVACTKEYARFHSAGAPADQTVARVLAAIVRTIDRVDGIYESELCVRLQLVEGNDRLIFTDATPAAEYPFSTNSDAQTLIEESQRTIDQIIGDENYDVGHTMSTGAGGLAGLGVACRRGQKARGVTGSSSPVGDPFDVDYVAHELGHQFGGNHTFNGSQGSCGSRNRNAATAVEPGSGSTIQAYAGICATDDLQRNSDDYFHSVSLEEMIAYTTTGDGSRPAPLATGNAPPTVRAAGPFVIPRGTPFTLTATGSDPDGDPLTYCWEQRDLGPSAGLGAPDDGRVPLFRSFRPVGTPERSFPRMAALAAGVPSPEEQLPSRARILHFRVTVRDGRGGTNGDDATVQIDEASGPFRVTAPTAGTQAGLITVTWDVARTDQAPVGVRFVDILLSQDGGNTFPVTLATNVPNDGQHTVALPPTPASAARIMVRAVGNIFFALSPSTFAIDSHRASLVVAPAGTGTGDLPATTLREPAGIQVDRVVRLKAGATASDFDRIVNDASGRPTLLIADSDTAQEFFARVGAVRPSPCESAILTLTERGALVKRLPPSTATSTIPRKPSSDQPPTPGGKSEDRELMRRVEDLERQFRLLRESIERRR